MGSGEASIRIEMQNAGLRNPPDQERGETLPFVPAKAASLDDSKPVDLPA